MKIVKTKDGYANGRTDQRKIWTRAETFHQKQVARELFVRGRNRLEVVAYLREKESLGKARAEKIADRVITEWQEWDDKNREKMKSLMLQRLQRGIRDTMGRKNEAGDWIEPPNHAAHVRYESLMADVLGLKEHTVRVETTVNVALVQMINELPPEQILEYMELHAANQRDAEAWRRENPQLPAKTEVLDAKGRKVG